MVNGQQKVIKQTTAYSQISTPNNLINSQCLQLWEYAFAYSKFYSYRGQTITAATLGAYIVICIGFKFIRYGNVAVLVAWMRPQGL